MFESDLRHLSLRRHVAAARASADLAKALFCSLHSRRFAHLRRRGGRLARMRLCCLI
jgi:hypothetical protein